jgi:hypothetical protein
MRYLYRIGIHRYSIQQGRFTRSGRGAFRGSDFAVDPGRQESLRVDSTTMRSNAYEIHMTVRGFRIACCSRMSFSYSARRHVSQKFVFRPPSFSVITQSTRNYTVHTSKDRLNDRAHVHHIQGEAPGASPLSKLLCSRACIRTWQMLFPFSSTSHGKPIHLKGAKKLLAEREELAFREPFA